MDTLFVDDKEGKPAAIAQFIGRRPIACFGNSDGDQAMLEYTTLDNARPSFGMIVHHTDAEREYAYDAQPKSSGKLVSALAAAPKRGWWVADMRADWKQVFPEEAMTKTPNQAATKLQESSWQVESIAGEAVNPAAAPTLDFSEEGRVSGSTGVNQLTGAVKLDGNRLSFGPVGNLTTCRSPRADATGTTFLASTGNRLPGDGRRSRRCAAAR